MNKILQTNTNNTAALMLRLFAGIVLFPHGAQKMLGWFGGFGFKNTMGYFTESVGLPWIVGFGVIIIEFIGSLSLITGFLTRFWAAAIIVLMLGIVVTTHLPFGFFMNWLGDQKGEGFEYHLLFIAIAGSLIISGGGKWSLDSRLIK